MQESAGNERLAEISQCLRSSGGAHRVRQRAPAQPFEGWPLLTLLPDEPVWPAVFVPQSWVQPDSDGLAVPSPQMSQRTIQPSPALLLDTPRSATAAIESMVGHGGALWAC